MSAQHRKYDCTVKQCVIFMHAFWFLYFYLNTVLHLVAVSYDRYNAIVRSPLTYNGTITMSEVVITVFIWIAPIPFTVNPGSLTEEFKILL